jgi:hypothetical protein
MTRAELQAVIWAQWPTRGLAAAASVDAILRAADEYRGCSGPPPHPDPVVQGRRDALLAGLMGDPQ